MMVRGIVVSLFIEEAEPGLANYTCYQTTNNFPNPLYFPSKI